jgi:hypothetical protein
MPSAMLASEGRRARNKKRSRENCSKQIQDWRLRLIEDRPIILPPDDYVEKIVVDGKAPGSRALPVDAALNLTREDCGRAARNQEREVDIRPLKEFARNRLDQNSPLLEVLLAEQDRLPASEFLAKMGIWQCLIRRECK